MLRVAVDGVACAPVVKKNNKFLYTVHFLNPTHYCTFCVLTMNHVLANPEALTPVSSSGKRKPIDNANVFVDRKAKRRRFKL